MHTETSNGTQSITIAAMRARAAALMLIAGLFAQPPAADAQAVDTSEWVCEFCPFESGHRGDYDVGASSVSEDTAHLQTAGYGDKGVVPNLDGDGAYSTERYRAQWTVEDLGLDSRFAELEVGRPGSYDFNVSYRQLPYRRFITTDTIFQATESDTLLLPAGWVRAGSTAGFTALDTSLEPRDIERKRQFFEIGGRYLVSSRLSFSADYRRQEQDGNRILGGSYFTTASQLPMPFNYVTDEVDLGVRYGDDRGYVSLAWYLSDFESGLTAFGWENPFTSAPGAGFGQLAQAPDNNFQQLTLTGGYRFPSTSTYVSVSASMGQIDQDASLLAYTTNSNLTTTPLPRTSLAGEIDTTSLALTLTSRPLDKTHVRLSYRYDERDNKTPIETWTRVITDTFLSGDPETNIPYSYERSTLSLSGDYDLLETLTVSAGYDRRQIDRDFQEVAEQTEDTGWGRLRWRPIRTLDIDVKGGTSKRDIDRYDTDVAVAAGQNPLLRKYNLAYRYREFGELTLTASLPETPVSVTISGMLADDSYTDSPLGLKSADDRRLAADVNWAISDTASIYINGGVESIESEQLGSESFASPDWRAMNEDEFVTIGGGFRVRRIADKVDLEFDYTRSDGASEIDVASASGGQSRFPDLESTFDSLRLGLTYQRSEQLTLSASLRYQRFETEDWALRDVGPATIPVVLSLGANPYDEEAVIVGLGFRYGVGGAAPAGAN